MKRAKLRFQISTNVVREILLYLNHCNITRLSRVNKQFYFVSYDQVVLKELARREGINIKKRLFQQTLRKDIFNHDDIIELRKQQEKEYLEQTYFFKSINNMIKIALSYNSKGILFLMNLVRMIPGISYYNTSFLKGSIEFANNNEFLSNNDQKIVTSRTKDLSVDITKIFNEFLVMKSKKSCCDFYQKLFEEKHIFCCLQPTGTTYVRDGRFLFALCFDMNKYQSNEEFKLTCEELDLMLPMIGKKVTNLQNNKYIVS